jgi:hypothetical protein
MIHCQGWRRAQEYVGTQLGQYGDIHDSALVRPLVVVAEPSVVQDLAPFTRMDRGALSIAAFRRSAPQGAPNECNKQRVRVWTDLDAGNLALRICEASSLCDPRLKRGLLGEGNPMKERLRRLNVLDRQAQRTRSLVSRRGRGRSSRKLRPLGSEFLNYDHARSAQRTRFKLQKPSGARFLSASNLSWAAGDREGQLAVACSTGRGVDLAGAVSSDPIAQGVGKKNRAGVVGLGWG